MLYFTFFKPFKYVILIFLWLLINLCSNSSLAIDPADIQSVEHQDSTQCIVSAKECGKDPYLTIDQLKEINPSANVNQIKYIYNLQEKYYKLFKKEYPQYKDSLDLPEVSKCVYFGWKVNSANGFLVDHSENIIKSSGHKPLDNFCLDLIKQCSPFEGLKTDSPDGKYNEIEIHFLFTRNVCQQINGKFVIIK